MADDTLYMTAEQAAEALGVSVTTIYAYVSRKQLRVHRPPGARASKYWRADVERMRRRSPAGVAHGAGDILVPETAITVMTEAGPFYRGRSAVTLSETATLEETAALLWQADEAQIFPAEAPPPSAAIEAFWPSLQDLPAVDKTLAIFPTVERENPRAYDLSPVGFARTAGEALRWFAAIMGGNPRPSAGPLHEVVAADADEPKAMQDVVRRLLVLSADHELDPTTYSVRAVANAGVNPYRLILAGLITSTGRRLAYGSADAAARLLEEISQSRSPKDAIIRRLREGETLPGFGTPLYTAQDPRAGALLAALNRNLDGDKELERLNAAIAVMRELTQLEPNFALATMFVGRKLGHSPRDGLTLRLGRMAGWMAHAMEQFHGRDVVRPRAAYTGPLPDRAPAA